MASGILKIAPPYDEALVSSVTERFQELLGEEVVFHVVEEPALLGGFIAMIAGTIYDASLKTRLDEAENYLKDGDEN